MLFLVHYIVFAALAHRYSFASDGSDAVAGGGWAISLLGGAVVSGGRLQLTSASSGAYASLPSNIVAGLPSFTIELWVTATGCASPGWCRLFQFGTIPGNNQNSVALINNANTNFLSLQFEDQYGGFNLQDTTVLFSSLVNAHVVLVLSEGQVGNLYVNGVRFTSAFTISIPGSPYFYVGSSIDAVDDPMLVGSIDELRIWSVALQPSDVAAHYSAGPDDPSLGNNLSYLLCGLEFSISCFCTVPLSFLFLFHSSIFCHVSATLNSLCHPFSSYRLSFSFCISFLT